eukprot:2952043-Pyramimonas_sp.AAC.2
MTNIKNPTPGVAMPHPTDDINRFAIFHGYPDQSRRRIRRTFLTPTNRAGVSAEYSWSSTTVVDTYGPIFLSCFSRRSMKLFMSTVLKGYSGS